MLKLGAFESSLRGGPDISTSINGNMTTPKTKQILQNHHKSCTGEHHGSGIEKWKRNQGRKPHHHHHHRHRNTSCSRHNRSRSLCSANSLDYSDTDSGQESLTSTLRATKTAHQSESRFITEDTACYDSNNECSSCDSHINKASHRLYSTPTKASAAKTAFHGSSHFDGDEIDVGKMAEDMCCVSPKNDNDDEDLTNNSFVGLRRQSAKTLALEGVEKISVRLGMRRKRRNERVTEHVAGSPRDSTVKVVGAGEEQRVRRSQLVKKSSLKSKNFQQLISEDRNVDQNLLKSVSAKNSMNKNASFKSPTELVTKDNSSVNIKTPDNDFQRNKKTAPIKNLLNVNGTGSQESVVGVGAYKFNRSRTPTRKSLKSSRVVNGRDNHESGPPLKSGILDGRATKPPGLKKPVPGGRRPPSGSKKFSGVFRVSWSELAETALNTKPSAHSTTSRNVLYKDLNQLLEDNKHLPEDDKVRQIFYHFCSDAVV